HPSEDKRTYVRLQLARPKRRRPPLGGLRANVPQEGGADALAALARLLQRASGGELWHARRRDRDLLARARINALPLLALLGRELPKAGKRHRLAAAECVRHTIHT